METCFVIQPFDGGGFDKRYHDVLAPAIRAASLNPYRVDLDPTAQALIETIEAEIRCAAVCLADVSLDNPNVWYEVGFASALNKPLVMICDNSRRSFPFDVQDRAVIKYASDSRSDFDALAAAVTDRLISLHVDGLVPPPGGLDDVRKVSHRERLVLDAVASSPDGLDGLSTHLIAHILRDTLSRSDVEGTVVRLVRRRLLTVHVRTDERFELEEGYALSAQGLATTSRLSQTDTHESAVDPF